MGWIRVAEWEKFKDDEYGIEPLTRDFTLKNLEKIILKSDKPIKALLMDQKKIAGLGNIYSSESLFQARINPFKIAKKAFNKRNRFSAQGDFEHYSARYSKKGSSMRDEMYLQVTGEPGEYQTQFLVYEKEGEKCSVCNEKIKRIKQNGRSTYYCPECQK